MKNFVGLFLGSRCIKRDYQENPKLFMAVFKSAFLLSAAILTLNLVSVGLLETKHIALGAIIRYGGALAAALWLSGKIPNIIIQDDTEKEKSE